MNLSLLLEFKRGCTIKNSYAQAKLVRVIEGKVLDVAVDIRRVHQLLGSMLQLN